MKATLRSKKSYDRTSHSLMSSKSTSLFRSLEGAQQDRWTSCRPDMVMRVHEFTGPEGSVSGTWTPLRTTEGSVSGTWTPLRTTEGSKAVCVRDMDSSQDHRAV